MILRLKRIIRKFKSCMLVMRGIGGNVSFSQYGEDNIMISVLDRLNLKSVSYLDIGANEPIRINNTYNLYLRGYSGVLIEPNAILCNKIKSVRPRDKVLNFGIGINDDKEADYYMFAGNDGIYNTFSKETAISTEKEGIPIQKVVKLPLKDINTVISENFSTAPTIISLDVEGLDEIILRKLDFEKYSPLLICVETVNFSTTSTLIKSNSLLDFLLSKGYFIYADTHVNTILCHQKTFDELLSLSKHC